GAADELLVLKGAVDFGGIEEGDAEFDGPMDGGDRFAFICRAIGPAHAHAAEAERGNVQAFAAERTCLHANTPANGIECARGCDTDAQPPHHRCEPGLAISRLSAAPPRPRRHAAMRAAKGALPRTCTSRCAYRGIPSYVIGGRRAARARSTLNEEIASCRARRSSPEVCSFPRARSPARTRPC